ncbi:MAG TPA: hypothetical protein VLC06_06605 [Polyangia bacterium]|nr:hypothetical protein [Polyangia bacterium]
MKLILGSVLLWAAVGCAGGAKSAGENSSSPPPNGTGTGNGSGTSNGTGGSTGSLDAGGPPLPPEMEVESSYEVPVATGSYIWVANPDSGRVAYVAGATLQVHTVEAGNAPTYISAIPSATDDAVVVLNVLSGDATILRVAAGGELTKSTVSGLAAGANALTVSPSGRWVTAWTDARNVASPDPLQGYQAVTLIDLSLTPPGKTILSVGFRPVDVAYAADDSAAFAVTEDGVSVVDLTRSDAPQVTGNVPLTDDPTENADTRDVSITPNGRLAVVRREGSASLGIVDLTSGTLGAIDLSGAITDVDLTADGQSAVAVVRDTAEVAIIPLGGGIPDPAAVQQVTIAGETVGSASIAADGKTVLLYTNAVAAERLTVLTLGPTPSYRVIKLHAPVLAVFATADASNAIVFHSESAAATTATTTDGGAGASADGGGAVTMDAGLPSQTATNAFSLVPLGADLPAVIQETDVPPQAVAITPAGDRVLVTERDDVKKIYGVYVGEFPSMEIQKIALASPPIAVGVLAAANEGYVAQKNAEGRITFVALDSGQARTLTGFEIGASVVDWAQGSDGGANP